MNDSIRKTLSILCLAILIFNACDSLAQDTVLYGITPEGGIDQTGTIFTIRPDGTNFTKVHEFQKVKGDIPVGELLLANNGLYYGMTKKGGRKDHGTIFSLDEEGNYTFLTEFNGKNGSRPSAGLMQAKNGKLYGTTEEGGTTYGDGVLFEYDIDSNTIKALFSFYAPHNAEDPQCKLVESDSNVLYGTAPSGWGHNGVIFSFDLVQDSFRIVKKLVYPAINTPLGGLARSSSGLLYGCASKGGQHNTGGAFSFNPEIDSFNLLFEPTEAQGSGMLYRPLITDNVMYISCHSGGSNNNGSLLSYSLHDDSLRVLHQFSSSSAFGKPCGSLVERNFYLFGMVKKGSGAFCFNLNSGKMEKSTALQENYGDDLSRTFTLTKRNVLLAACIKPGSINHGTIFELDLTKFQDRKIVRFDRAINGYYPSGGILLASDSMLYGTTTYGGLNDNQGTLYRIDPKTNSFVKLADLGSHGLSNPTGMLVEGPDRKIYGVAGGSSSSKSQLFRYDLNTGRISLIYTFSNIYSIQDGLWVEPDGMMYGSAMKAGSHGKGGVFKFDPYSEAVTILDSYDNNTGEGVFGRLTGITENTLVGVSLSSIFSFDKSTKQLSPLVQFGSSTKVSGASFGLFYDQQSKWLYGLSANGGIRNNGIVYRYSIDSAIFEVLHELDKDLHGSYALSRFIKASNSKLYTMTRSGGQNNSGTILCYDPELDSLYSIYHFSYLNGRAPQKSILTEYGPHVEITSTYGTILPKVQVYPNPNSGRFKVNLPVNEHVVQIEIYDLMGREIESHFTQGQSKASIELESCSGIHYVNIFTNKGFYWIKVLLQE